MSIVVTLVTSEVTHVHAQPESSGLDALPGVHEVPLAASSGQGLKVRLGAGYGWTEAVLDRGDTHHRAQADAAMSVTPLSWLSAAVRLLGRYDVHSGGVDDDGAITETHAGARAHVPLGASFHAGGDLGLWLPSGSDVGSALSALSFDAQLLLTYASERTPLTVGLALGLRVDRSRYAGGDVADYSAADRLSASVSESVFALRQGVAVAYRTGPIAWLAEWAFRMYLERAATSPMWVRAGARIWPVPRLQLELLLGVSPSKRPPLERGAPLAVVEPRLAAGISATYSWPVDAPQPLAAAPIPVVAPRPVQLASLRGRVSTPSGTGFEGATVTLARSDKQQTATSDAQGAFAFTELPAGSYAIGVAAAGFIADPQTIELRAGDASELNVELKRALPQGQIRGTVRRFNGKPVAASIAIGELGVTQTTRDDGTFEIDVPPGEYSVSVKARGFRVQTRKARVEQHGVAILIVELEVAR